MSDRRVVFDFEIDLSDGGRLQGRDFRLDVADDELDDRTLADRVVGELRLRPVSAIRIRNRRIVEGPDRHAATGTSDPAAGMSDATPARLPPGTLVDLSHPIRDGMITYPGLPGPTIGTHLSREASRERYEAGTEFHIGTISMVANTGTYLDSPFHRYADGVDLAGLAASTCADVSGVVVRVGDRRAIGPELLVGIDTRDRAVLFHTGWDRHFETPAYAVDAPFVTEETARRLADGGARLVGIDSVNVDDISGNRRPAHSVLLAAGVPLLEHLTALERLPDRGFAVTALAPRIVGLGTFPVRVVARIVE